MVGIFPICPDLPSDPPSLLYNWYRVFTRVKAAGAWSWPPTSSCVQVKETVQLHLYYPCGPSGQVTGWTLPFMVKRWNYVTDKEWEVYWLITNGKDKEGSHGLCVASTGFPLVTGWKGIPSSWWSIFVSALQAVLPTWLLCSENWRKWKMCRRESEMERRKAMKIETDGIWPAFLNGPWWYST